MKTIPVILLPLVAILTSCKDQTEEIEPEKVYEGCRPIYAKLRNVQAEGPETLVIDGQTLKVTPPLAILHQGFDEKGRIKSRLYNYHTYYRWDLTVYTYTDSTLTIHDNTSLGGAGVKQIIPLNSQGYPTKFSNTTYTYNSDGYYIESKSPNVVWTRNITNGNVTIRHIQNLTYLKTSQTTTYTYDLTKASVPIGLFFGKPDKNLCTGEITVTKDSTGKVTNTSATTYKYLFDNLGRAYQRVTFNNKNEVGNIEEYGYECK